MYGRFLKEAASITDDARFRDAGLEINAIGDQWQEVAHLFTGAAGSPDMAPKLEEASAQLLAVADREQDVWEQLQRLAQ